MNNDNKTFCILPWVHMHMWPNGITYPCCLATNDYVIGNTNKESFKDLWNSERMRELRRNMLDGKPTSGCSRCYEHEENGSRSLSAIDFLIHWVICNHSASNSDKRSISRYLMLTIRDIGAATDIESRFTWQMMR